jgi:sulfoxide reductase heme-binding subunit YedZ
MIPDVENRRPATDSPIVLRSTRLAWASCALAGAAFVFLVMVYHDLCRGKTYSMQTANEGLALAGIFGLGCALALGPLHRLCGGLPRVVRWRRALGVTAVIFAAAHVLVSLIPMWKEYGGRAYYAKHWDFTVLGIAAMGLLLAIARSSGERALRRMGAARWRRLQMLSFLALVLVLAHFLVLGKVSKWVEWFQERKHPGPPGTFFAMLFGAFVLALKGVDLLVMRHRMRKPVPAQRPNDERKLQQL